MSRDSLTIGQMIKLYRKQRKLTQKELGEACGVASRTVSRLERSKGYRLIQVGTLLKLTNYLGVPGFTVLDAMGLKNLVEKKKKYNKKEKKKSTWVLKIAAVMILTGAIFLGMSLWKVKAEAHEIRDYPVIIRPTVPVPSDEIILIP